MSKQTFIWTRYFSTCQSTQRCFLWHFLRPLTIKIFIANVGCYIQFCQLSAPFRIASVRGPRCFRIKTRPYCFIRILSVCQTIYCFLLRRITAPIFSARAEYVTLHSLVLWPNKRARSARQNHTAPVYLHNSHSITGPTRELFCPPHRARSAILVSYTARASATFIAVIIYVHFPERQFSTLYVQVLTP